jgi:hypothetical protein
VKMIFTQGDHDALDRLRKIAKGAPWEPGDRNVLMWAVVILEGLMHSPEPPEVLKPPENHNHKPEEPA